MGAILVPSAARVSNDKTKLMEELKQKAPDIMQQWKKAEQSMISLNKQLIACLNVKTRAIRPNMKARFMFLKGSIINKRWEIQCLSQVLTGIQDIVTVMNVHTAYNTISEMDTKKNVERILASLEHELNKKLQNMSSGDQVASRIGATMSQTHRIDQHLDARIDAKDSLNEAPSVQAESATNANEAFIDELLGSASELQMEDVDEEDKDSENLTNDASFDKDILTTLGLVPEESDEEDEPITAREEPEKKVALANTSHSVQWPSIERRGQLPYGRGGKRPGNSSSTSVVGADKPINFKKPAAKKRIEAA